MLLSEIKNYINKLGTCLSAISYSACQWEGAKLEIEGGMNLICQGCKSVTSVNIVAFTQGSAGNVQGYLLAIKDVANIKKNKRLILLLFR